MPFKWSDGTLREWDSEKKRFVIVGHHDPSKPTSVTTPKPAPRGSLPKNYAKVFATIGDSKTASELKQRLGLDQEAPLPWQKRDTTLNYNKEKDVFEEVEQKNPAFKFLPEKLKNDDPVYAAEWKPDLSNIRIEERDGIAYEVVDFTRYINGQLQKMTEELELGDASTLPNVNDDFWTTHYATMTPTSPSMFPEAYASSYEKEPDYGGGSFEPVSKERPHMFAGLTRTEKIIIGVAAVAGISSAFLLVALRK